MIAHIHKFERRGLTRRMATPYFKYIGCSYGREIWIYLGILLVIAYFGIRYHI